MSIFEFGTSVSDLRKSIGTMGVTTSGTNIETAYVNEGVVIPTNGYAYFRQWAPQSDGCFSIQMRPTGSDTLKTTTLFAFNDEDDNSVLKLVRASASTIKLQALIGGVWTDIGTAWTRDTAKHRHVFIWDFSSSGRIAWYIDAGTAHAVDETGDYSTVPAIASGIVGDWPDSTAEDTCFSEWVGLNEVSLTIRYKQNPPTSDGANTDFTGGFGNIDETGINRTDAIVSNTDGDISTFKAAARTFASPNKVLALAIPVYGRKSNSGPNKVIPMIRKGGVDYEAGDPVELTFGNRSHAIVIPIDPATSADWTLADANDANLEFGIKSAS